MSRLVQLLGSGRWTRRAGLFAVIVLLLLVSNPELRALLLLADAIGLELLLLLVLSQARGLLPLALGYAGLIGAAYGPVLQRGLAWLLAALQGLLPRGLLWLGHAVLWTRAALAR